jgi:hypothetical protein
MRAVGLVKGLVAAQTAAGVRFMMRIHATGAKMIWVWLL